MKRPKSIEVSITRKSAVAGPKTAHISEITSYFEFSVLTLTGSSEPSRTGSSERGRTGSSERGRTGPSELSRTGSSESSRTGPSELSRTGSGGFSRVVPGLRIWEQKNT